MNISGGVSGLFAALKLAENNHKHVTVIEVRSFNVKCRRQIKRRWDYYVLCTKFFVTLLVFGPHLVYTITQALYTLDIILCQADSRFGGRVRSLPFNDGVIGLDHAEMLLCVIICFLELGAQWIHGRGECPLWKFVNDNQIPGEINVNWQGQSQSQGLIQHDVISISYITCPVI